jgi:hypothetical protein
MQDGPRHVEGLRGRPDRQVRGLLERDGIDVYAGTTEPTSSRLHASESGSDPLCDSRPLEFRERAEDVQLEFSRRRAGVDPLAEGHEPDADRLQCIDQGNQVLQIPPEPIEPPT